MSSVGPPSYHDKYVYHNFYLGAHGCKGGCGCAAAGCTEHWQWKHGSPPPMTTKPWDYRCVDYQLYRFGAYRGWVPGKTKQQRFLGNYHNIVQWVRQLDGTTIFCNWDRDVVGNVYDSVKNIIYAGQAVPATKTLYFFVPDLFIILDRGQTWPKWKRECQSLPRHINSVSGENYVMLLDHVRNKICSAIRSGGSFALGTSPPVTVTSVDQLRLRYPLQLHRQEEIGHTLGKVIDNIIRGKPMGGASPSSIGSPPPTGSDE